MVVKSPVPSAATTAFGASSFAGPEITAASCAGRPEHAPGARAESPSTGRLRISRSPIPRLAIDHSAVDVHVSEREAFDVLDEVRLGDAAEVTVDDRDVADRRVLEAAQIQRVLR